jgi:hypothetical protein
VVQIHHEAPTSIDTAVAKWEGIGLQNPGTRSDTGVPSEREERCSLYIVRRTQLYLDDHLWDALHARARSRKTTISELVREAVRERYVGKQEERMRAMKEFVGIRKKRSEDPGAV